MRRKSPFRHVCLGSTVHAHFTHLHLHLRIGSQILLRYLYEFIMINNYLIEETSVFIPLTI